jgi:lambda repressor-like predicted transcriptional regulator
MKPEDIQCALKKKRVTQKDIAINLGVSPMSVSTIINKHRTSDRIMRAVATAIGREHWQVFPEYYLQPPKRKTSKVAAM